MIGDINDPALNYLDSVRTSAPVKTKVTSVRQLQLE